MQESCSLRWCLGLHAASSSAPSALSSMWMLFSLTLVSFTFFPELHYSSCPFCVCGIPTAPLCLSAGILGITPDDPRWIGAWWAGFLLCGALLFCSALLMFGFPQSLPTKEREEGADSEQVMLPPSLSQDYETPKPSNGIAHNHEPANSPTCCQQLRGERTDPV